MDIQQLISADQDLLLRLNDGHTLFWDGFMWVCTSTVIWIPVAAMLLYVLFKNNKPWEAITLVLMVGLVITLPTSLLLPSASPISCASDRHKIPSSCIW